MNESLQTEIRIRGDGCDDSTVALAVACERSSCAERCRRGPLNTLEPMQLDGTLGDAFLDEEVGDLKALVALELDDLPVLLVVNEGAVAGKLLLDGSARSSERDGWAHLLESLEELLGIVLCTEPIAISVRRSVPHVIGGERRTLGQALQRRQRLTTIPLLDTDMDVVLLGADLISYSIPFVRERVWEGGGLCERAGQPRRAARTDRKC